jgi:ATP-dependent DNA helicase RecQ
VAHHSELAELELRRWRRELARELDVPPYIIFNDATIRALATTLPVDRASFLGVKGAGESRWERFGPKVVEISRLARAAGHQPGAAVVAVAPRLRRGA